MFGMQSANAYPWWLTVTSSSCHYFCNNLFSKRGRTDVLSREACPVYYTQCNTEKVIPERGLMTQMTFSGSMVLEAMEAMCTQ